MTAAIVARLAAARLTIAAETLLQAAKANFNPSQPRVPAGEPEGGQWTGTSAGLGRYRLAGLEDICDAQYERDIFQCRLVGSPACYAQAAQRYAACLAGRSLPPFNY
jgi:hypothetical protein